MDPAAGRSTSYTAEDPAGGGRAPEHGPSEEAPAEWPAEEWPLTALLRGARAVVAPAVRQGLAGAGYDDLPPNGPYVIGAIARTSAPLASVVRQLGVSRATSGQPSATAICGRPARCWGR